MKKVIKYLKNPKLIIIYLMNKNFFFFLSDKLFLKWKFKILMGYKLDLNNPQTFNEKLQWLKLYDRKPTYTKMVDKYEAKEYVKNIIGEEHIIKTLGIYNSFEEIDFEKLPNQFVIKPTHTSGDVYICTDKSNINYKELENKIKKWLKRKYFYIHREWPYKNVKPRIIIEEYLSDLKEGSLPDNYKEMVAMAKRISKGTIESRIDFYDINGKIYFGEITFFDSAGFGKFEPNEWDKKIGDMLKLPMKEEK